MVWGFGVQRSRCLMFRLLANVQGLRFIRFGFGLKAKKLKDLNCKLRTRKSASLRHVSPMPKSGIGCRFNGLSVGFRLVWVEGFRSLSQNPIYPTPPARNRNPAMNSKLRDTQKTHAQNPEHYNPRALKPLGPNPKSQP